MSDDKLIPFNPDKSLRADAIRNRRILLDTAERLFEQKSVEDVTMSAIAKAAGVGKGTLYRNFTDKAELCVALLDEDMQQFQQKTLEYIGCCEDARDCLKWFLENAAAYVVKHSDLLLEAANQGVSVCYAILHISGGDKRLWVCSTVLNLQATRVTLPICFI